MQRVTPGSLLIRNSFPVTFNDQARFEMGRPFGLIGCDGKQIDYFGGFPADWNPVPIVPDVIQCALVVSSKREELIVLQGSIGIATVFWTPNASVFFDVLPPHNAEKGRIWEFWR